ncbi:LL-diaminopimelate aminotransferase [Pelotomaculum propionicicum]|uniref:Aminotransferase n=1 Tax=Pelotomaculum propionicicum TaxID=258475 RepID=A0A4Y7RV20_9FIRM|nr:LL-diaminopimelate aminotransferase [Pelotomaculum propionicicum]NLI12674.1 LL-diaminopimelate aminotransferase [Peptococcaceae bacterium]TEB12610.1 LL-diaminopimelate aminotransferase [Pelotomaculum propionicicum]
MKKASRMGSLASGIFNEMEERRKKVEARGVKVINLGVGSPDLPPAQHIIESLKKSVENPLNYSYSLGGMPRLYQAVAGWYKKRFNVELNPDKEILALMGSQDGLAHLAMAYIDPGDLALVPDPGYPIYSFSILMAQGEVYPLPILQKNNFLPDLSAIPEEIAKKAKMMWLNYPNNPTAASANREFFERVVEFAVKYDILICHDVAYAELAYDNFKPMSFLEVAGAKEVGVEFYSLSKTYNMAGCRLGFVVGNSEVIANLGLIKSNIDYGVFFAVQEAGIAALTGPQDCVTATAQTYQRRRDVLVDGFAEIGWQMPKPSASMFIWAPLPPGFSSCTAFVTELLEKAGVIVIPGIAFGNQGEGYVRIAMVEDESVLAETVNRVRSSFKFK